MSIDKKKEPKAIEALQRPGFYVEEDSLPWRDVFKEFGSNEAGVCLAGGRHKEGLTQKKAVRNDRNTTKAYIRNGERQTSHRQKNGHSAR